MTPIVRHPHRLLLLLLPVLLFVVGCGLLEQTAEPTPTTPAETTPEATDVAEDIEPREVEIESVEILLLESFPVQVNLIVSGNLPNACWTLNEPRPRREGNTFIVSLIASRLPDEVCTEALVPFDQVIPLDVEGLPAGAYSVAVNGTTDTFTLDVDNILQTPEASETPESEATPTAVAEDVAGTITGLVWHDLCGITGGEGGQPAVPSAGCVALDDGSYAADGVLDEDEPGIGDVVVSLGVGACPAPETATAITDANGNYRFEGLEPGSYCISVDALSTGNSSLLIPGEWTAPVSNAGVGLTNVTVTLGENQGAEDVNFGWDYQFLPLPEGQAGSTKGCTDAAEFIADVTVLDNAVMPPGLPFTKTWRLANAGTCTWNGDYDLIFIAGDQMGAPATIPLPGDVVPTATVDLTVPLIAPERDGTYRGDWALRNDIGEVFGIPVNLEFWVLIEVTAEVIPEGANISGLVWSDLCPSTAGITGAPDCVETDEEGVFLANGVYDGGEPRLPGVTVALGQGACPATTVSATTTTDQAGRFIFTGLTPGTYCIFINAAGGNSRVLNQGAWSWPADTEGQTAGITVEVEEFFTAVDNWFGWDFQAE